MDLDAFVRDGHVAIRGAVDAGTVAGCRELIWAAMERRGVRRDDPGSWPPLVEDMGGLAGEPFDATGKAGDVFLCHPFIVHTATWPHRGSGPRMIAQPAVNAPGGFILDGSDPSPVAQCIVKGLAVAT